MASHRRTEQRARSTAVQADGLKPRDDAIRILIHAANRDLAWLILLTLWVLLLTVAVLA